MQNKASPKTIVLTGATGALGSELLPRLLLRYPDHKVVAIVRGKSPDHARQRLVATMDDPALWSRYGDRIEVLCGDVGLPLFGLDETQAHQLCATTDKVFHFAANVRFSATLPESRAGNVDTTRVVIDFSRRCHQSRSGDFQLHYASTAYVVGDRQGPLFEEELDYGQGFSNAYEQSKFEAECLAVDARKDLSVTIYRPSQVMCMTTDGKMRKLFGFLEVIKIICNKKTPIPYLPGHPDVRTDMVPIDFVSDGIAYLSGEPDALGKTHLLAAGLAHSLPVSRTAEIALGTIRKYATPGEIPDIEYVSIAEFENKAAHGEIHGGLVALLSIYQTYLCRDRDFRPTATHERLARGGIFLPSMEQAVSASVRHIVAQHYRMPELISA